MKKIALSQHKNNKIFRLAHQRLILYNVGFYLLKEQAN